jgi:hypothetical protein
VTHRLVQLRRPISDVPPPFLYSHPSLFARVSRRFAFTYEQSKHGVQGSKVVGDVLSNTPHSSSSTESLGPTQVAQRLHTYLLLYFIIVASIQSQTPSDLLPDGGPPPP